ncbi:hypothetical protein [Lysinibacillus sp. 54212]
MAYLFKRCSYASKRWAIRTKAVRMRVKRWSYPNKRVGHPH